MTAKMVKVDNYSVSYLILHSFCMYIFSSCDVCKILC